MSKDRPPPFSNRPHSVPVEPIPADQRSRLEECLFRGDKIQAIKINRERTGARLAVCKAAVDQLERELRAASPEKFTAPACGKSGCLSVMLALGLAVTVGIGWIVCR